MPVSKTAAVAAVTDLMDGDDKIFREAILEEDRSLLELELWLVVAELIYGRAENVERDDVAFYGRNILIPWYYPRKLSMGNSMCFDEALGLGIPP